MKILAIVFICLFPIKTAGQKTKINYLVSFLDSSSGKKLYGFKDKSGKISIPAKYTSIYTDSFHKFAIVALDYKWVGINRQDSIVLVPFIFDNGPDYIQEGLFRFVENNKIGFADSKGNKIITAKFDFVAPFQNGLAAFNVGGHDKKIGSEHSVWTGGVWGFVNKKGTTVIKAQFREVSDFDRSTTEAVTKDGKSVVIDKKGNIISINTQN